MSTLTKRTMVKFRQMNTDGIKLAEKRIILNAKDNY